MLRSVARHNIKPQTIYATECPYCNEMTYVFDNEDDVYNENDFECEKCCSSVEIIDEE